MNKHFVVIVFLGLLGLLPGVSAATSTGFRALGLYELTEATGRLAFTLAGYSDSSNGCVYANQFAIYKTETSYKEVMAVLMNAKLLGHNVNVIYSGCDPTDGYYMKIDAIYLE